MTDLEQRLAKLQKQFHGLRIMGGEGVIVHGSPGKGYAVEIRAGAADSSGGGEGGPGPTPTGACCIGTDCHILTSADCATMGGIYHGDGVPCDPDPCTGACCFADGTCTAETLIECGNAGGSYLGDGVTCSPNPCSQCGCSINSIEITLHISGATTGIGSVDCGDFSVTRPCCEREVDRTFNITYTKGVTEGWADCCSIPFFAADSDWDSGGSGFGTTCEHGWNICGTTGMTDITTPGQGSNDFEVFFSLTLSGGLTIDAEYQVTCAEFNGTSFPGPHCTEHFFFGSNTGPVADFNALIGSHFFTQHITGNELDGLGNPCASYDYTYDVTFVIG